MFRSRLKLHTLPGLLLLAFVVPTHGQDPVLQNTWVPVGTVTALAVSDGITYIGGDFAEVGPYLGSAVPLDTTSGQASGAFPKVEGGGTRIVIGDGNGGWYIGGTFTQVGGVPKNYLAHIRSDRTLDTSWNPNPNNVVNGLALDGTTLYVVGDFSSIGGQIRQTVAAIDTTSGSALAWNPQVDNLVSAIAVDNNAVYLGGFFAKVGGQNRSSFAAVNKTTGAPLSWTMDVGDAGTFVGQVKSLALAGTTLYIGGMFGSVGGQTRTNLASIDTAAHTVNNWTPAPDFEVETVVYYQGTVYAGGQFSNVNGQPHAGIVAVDGTSGAVSSWDPHLVGSPTGAYAILPTPTAIYLGGNFSQVGGQVRLGIAAVDLAGNVLPFGPHLDGFALSMVLNGNTLYVGGSFEIVGSQTRQHLAAIDNTTGVLTSWNPTADSIIADAVSGITVSGNTIYLSGEFDAVGGQPRQFLAAVGKDGTLSNWNPQPDAYVATVVSDGNKIYVGGDFTHIAGQARNFLAAFDTNGNLTNWAPAVDGNVRALLLNGSSVYVGGMFTHAGGQARNYAAAFDANANLLAWNPNAGLNVDHLATDGKSIYLSGDFLTLHGQNRLHLGAVDLSAGNATGWIADVSGSVAGLAIGGNNLFVGGLFSSIGGQSRTNLASVTLDTAQVAPWNPSPDDRLYAVAADAFVVAGGGPFLKLGSLRQPHFAEFSTSSGLRPPSITSIMPSSGTASGGLSVTIEGTNFQVGATVTIGGNAARAVVVANSNEITATTPGGSPGPADVVVTNPDSQSATLAGGFTYLGASSAASDRPIRVYPNPFHASRDSAVTFDVPAGASVKIFTATGERVRELNDDGSGRIVWDVKNARGEAVATGTYPFAISSSARSKTGQVIVIR